ncbi:MAG TPA: outer membrane protein assembly factor BamD [Candidatus Binataceae bacterium]|jgi:outer membrane protein assembly factor BamD|nr:outer membrane protein assembly factor BamD [Candidatus Binataceae bacterium]
MRHSRLVLAACLALGVAACSLRQQLPTGENYYALGQQAYATHDYKGATIYFQKLIDQYPFSPYAEDAELKIGLAQYQMKHYAEAIASLTDFEKMHPTSKQIELASYYLAMAHFDQIGRPDQDQTHTRLALEQFEIIERRYPETGFAALAHQQIAICREMLARHQLLIGDFYYSRANFRAAESRLAELMQKWPDTPVGDEALYQLGDVLEKEGKKYSAAQAYTAEVLHYPGTEYAKKAEAKLKKLHQPVDTEEDPLKLVLAESGFGDNSPDNVTVRQGDDAALAAASDSKAIYGADGLPNLERAAASAKPAGASTIAAHPATAPAGAPGSSAAGTAAAQSVARASEHGALPGVLKAPAPTGPATLDRIRLSSADPPLSVIFDLTGPVAYDNELQSGNGYSTLTIHLKDTRPAPKMASHLVFDRSIFRDCDIEAKADGTTVTVNTSPVSRFAVVPLQSPPRLLITFTPENGQGAPDQAADASGSQL